VLRRGIRGLVGRLRTPDGFVRTAEAYLVSDLIERLVWEYIQWKANAEAADDKDPAAGTEPAKIQAGMP
jgi:hypothetical protein